MRNYDLELPISLENVAIQKDLEKCISCGHCTKVCDEEITKQQKIDMEEEREPLCISCGQCTLICPVESLHERMHMQKVKSIIENKEGKVLVFSVDSSVGVSIAEEFGLEEGTNLTSKIPTALRALGADYVFSLSFGSDLHILETSMELVNRILSNGPTLYTSSCPSWTEYAQVFFPEIRSSLSTCKTPMSIQSSIIKTYYATKMKKLPAEIIHIVITSCTAKKREAKDSEIKVTEQDTDYVLTTREFARLLKEKNIDLSKIEDTNYDEPTKNSSAMSLSMHRTGGLAESIIKCSYYLLTNQKEGINHLSLDELKGTQAIKETSIQIKNKTIKVAVINGIKNVKEFMEKHNQDDAYDLVEVMTCQGGCISGGGQPKATLLKMQETKQKRREILDQEERETLVSTSYDNKEIKRIYQQFLQEPGSKIARQLLHTTYQDKSYLLGGK